MPGFSLTFSLPTVLLYFLLRFPSKIVTRKRLKCPKVLILRLVFLIIIRLHANLEFKQEVVHLPIIRYKTKQKSPFTTSHGWQKSWEEAKLKESVVVVFFFFFFFFLFLFAVVVILFILHFQ